MYHFLPLSPRSPLHGPYTGEFRGHTHSYPTHTHYRTNLRVSKLLWFSLQFQLPLWKKIESSAFIKMGDLIPTRLGLDDTLRSKLRCFITNITEWLQAFTVYISVIAKTQPHRISNLMGYQILIPEASNELVQFFLGKHFKWFLGKI